MANGNITASRIAMTGSTSGMFKTSTVSLWSEKSEASAIVQLLHFLVDHSSR